jgi:hypothetical protein
MNLKFNYKMSMKKIIFFLPVIVLVSLVLGPASNDVYSQVKVNYKLSNPTVNGNIFSLDLIATIPAGQQWRVGPTCIRVSFTSEPPRAVTVREDDPATNANLNISNNANYADMTTTGIIGDSSISLNILQLFGQPDYTFASGGQYTLGSIRFNVVNPNACITATILPISAVFDSLTPLAYNTQWTKTDSGCSPIGINVQLINQVPRTYKLYQNYPNPFNPVTKIRYEIPKAADVKIEIFDELGRTVETIVNHAQQPGVYEAMWDASAYSSGLYFFRMTAGTYVQTNKMVLIK